MARSIYSENHIHITNQSLIIAGTLEIVAPYHEQWIDPQTNDTDEILKDDIRALQAAVEHVRPNLSTPVIHHHATWGLSAVAMLTSAWGLLVICRRRKEERKLLEKTFRDTFELH